MSVQILYHWIRARYASAQMQLVDAPVRVTEQLMGWQTNTAEFDVWDQPDIRYGRTIELWQVNQGNATQRMLYSGYLDHHEAESEPRRVSFRCIGPLSQLDRVHRGNRGMDFSGKTDTQAIKDILDYCDIPYQASDIKGTGWKLGTVVPFKWRNQQPAIDILKQIDEATGCATFETPTGRVARIVLDLVPRKADIRKTYVAGVDAELWRVNLAGGGRDQIQNRWEVRGATFKKPGRKDCTYQPVARCTGKHPRHADFKYTARQTFQSDVIQSRAQAKAVCKRMLRWYNREPYVIGLRALNDPRIFAGVTIGVVDLSYGIALPFGNDQAGVPARVLTVEREGHSMTLTLQMGQAGDVSHNEGGYERTCNRNRSEDPDPPDGVDPDDGDPFDPPDPTPDTDIPDVPETDYDPAPEVPPPPLPDPILPPDPCTGMPPIANSTCVDGITMLPNGNCACSGHECDPVDEAEQCDPCDEGDFFPPPSQDMPTGSCVDGKFILPNGNCACSGGECDPVDEAESCDPCGDGAPPDPPDADQGDPDPNPCEPGDPFCDCGDDVVIFPSDLVANVPFRVLTGSWSFTTDGAPDFHAQNYQCNTQSGQVAYNTTEPPTPKVQANDFQIEPDYQVVVTGKVQFTYENSNMQITIRNTDVSGANSANAVFYTVPGVSIVGEHAGVHVATETDAGEVTGSSYDHPHPACPYGVLNSNTGNYQGDGQPAGEPLDFMIAFDQTGWPPRATFEWGGFNEYGEDRTTDFGTCDPCFGCPEDTCSERGHTGHWLWIRCAGPGGETYDADHPACILSDLRLNGNSISGGTCTPNPDYCSSLGNGNCTEGPAGSEGGLPPVDTDTGGVEGYGGISQAPLTGGGDFDVGPGGFGPGSEGLDCGDGETDPYPPAEE